MKKAMFIILLCSNIFIYTGCNFSVGAKADLATGLATTYKGFSIEDAYVTIEDSTGETKLGTNEIPLGKVVNVRITGVDNFAEKEGKVFPGCTIILSDTSGKELLNLPDIFESQNGGVKKEDATNLRAKLTTGEPMMPGEKYLLHTRFFDKKNKDSEIECKIFLIIK
jgi:hypothetical protein